MWFRVRRWHDGLNERLCGAFPVLGRPQVQNIQVRYDKAGVAVVNEPIPWNAEGVVVEAFLRCPHKGSWPRNDFYLRVPGQPAVTATTLQPQKEDVFALGFRLPPPRQTLVVELCWRARVLASVVLPFLSAEEFLGSLRLQSPTVFARLGGEQVPCQTLVEGQCAGIQAGGLLTCPTSLLPLVDLDLTAELTTQRLGQAQVVPLRLTRAQLTGNQALLSVTPPGWPDRLGIWSVRWAVAGRLLASSTVRVISPRTFQQSLYLIDARYVYQARTGVTAFSPHLPARDSIDRLGPCFRLASREPGMAAVCPLEVSAHFRSAPGAATLLEGDVLVTDAPVLLMPATLAVEDFPQVTSFKLLSNGQTLGLLPGCHRPVATFTSEGGFRGPADSDWTLISDEEMTDRLARLMETEPAEARDSSVSSER